MVGLLSLSAAFVGCGSKPDAEVPYHLRELVGPHHSPAEAKLIAGVVEDDASKIEGALGEGASIDTRSDTGGGDMLTLAAGKGKVAAVAVLLQRGNYPPSRKKEAFQRAATKGHVQVAEILLKQGLAQDKKLLQETFYNLAAQSDLPTADGPKEFPGDDGWRLEPAGVAMLTLLLKNGATVDGRVNGSTPLMAAAEYNRAEIAYELLKRGADIRLKDKDGKTAMDNAKSGYGSPVYGSIIPLLKWAETRQRKAK